MIVIIAAVGVLLLVVPAALLAIYFVISVDSTQRQASVATTRLQMQILADAMQLHRLQTRTSAATLEQLIPYLDATEVR